jgi:hypothetical protein
VQERHMMIAVKPLVWCNTERMRQKEYTNAESDE